MKRGRRRSRAAARGALSLVAALVQVRAEAPAYDPLAAAAEAAKGNIGNIEAGIPPQCYTRTGANSNPCYVCHTAANGRNRSDDWELQRRYAFSAAGRTNHWTNLFQDRRAQRARADEPAILSWVREDNYTPLRSALAALDEFPGWKPDLDYAAGFDAEGFARDGSNWRAFRYKPFPGTFWPTNGSTDDVMIRLPPAFRSDAGGRDSREVYKANLAIVEAAVAVADRVPDAQLARAVEAVDEAAAGADLDGDGRLAGRATLLRRLPTHYAGAAAQVPVVRWAYPLGTEFLHTVHYLDPDAPELRATRIKEVRYARKRRWLSDELLERRYREEALEQERGGRPYYGGTAATGQSNEFGWLLQGWIEDAQGRLRLQTREEQLYCMGCHSGLGVTVDQTFALPRKLPGAPGWGWQRVAGQRDVPTAGTREPEYQRYLRRVGAGDEFRANLEMLARFFRSGRLAPAAVRRAQSGPAGLLGLIAPSRARALALDRAYLALVREQSYRYGRDALLAPATNVHRQLDNSETALAASGRVYRDYRLWLDWDAR